MNLYDSSALYRQNMSPMQQEKFYKFYQALLGGYNITKIHDCSIGAGGSTLPLADLGYQVSGSDLSDNLLEKAKENFESKGHHINLFNADFRNLHHKLADGYDCIISTGNSLPHICNDDVESFIKNMSQKLQTNGFLYMDTRNWDKILDERPIFSARDPFVMTKEEHTSLYQVWNWHDDDSVDFVFVTSTDRNGQHESTAFTYAPRYYLLRFKDLKTMLTKHGFQVVACYDVDYLWVDKNKDSAKLRDFGEDFSDVNWYAVLAQKIT